MSDLLARTEAKLACDPVLLTAEEGVFFSNRDWSVTPEGLEHRNGYFIPRDEIGQRRADGVWLWPVHMAEKLWCEADSFREAFLAAVRAYGLTADAGLALALAEAAEPQHPAETPLVYDLRRPPGRPSSERRTAASDFGREARSSRSPFAEAA